MISDKIREIYDSKSILRSLVSKSLFGHYRNSILGFGWHFVLPLILMTVYYIVFTEIRASPMQDFWAFIACGIFPFNFMMTNLTGGASAIVSNAGIIKKMYFPREIIVLANVISSFIVMIIGYGLILTLMAIFGITLNPIVLLLLPIYFMLMAIFVIGYTLLFSSLTVYIRDIQFFLSSISTIFFFLTPMYFSSTDISGMMGNIIWVNPFTYFIEAFHKIVYYGTIPEIDLLAMCIILSMTSLTIGIVVFHKLKRGFAERL